MTLCHSAEHKIAMQNSQNKFFNQNFEILPFVFPKICLWYFCILLIFTAMGHMVLLSGHSQEDRHIKEDSFTFH